MAAAAARPDTIRSRPGRPNTARGDRCPLPVDPANDSEREAAAGRVVRAGLDADKTVVPEKDVASENGAQLGGPHHRLSANKHASVPLNLRDTRAGNP